MERWKSHNIENIICLHNKTPVWNEGRRGISRISTVTTVSPGGHFYERYAGNDQNTRHSLLPSKIALLQINYFGILVKSVRNISSASALARERNLAAGGNDIL